LRRRHTAISSVRRRSDDPVIGDQVERRGVRLWTIESSPHAANAMRSWLSRMNFRAHHHHLPI
jgi:hypothetical protein